MDDKTLIQKARSGDLDGLKATEIIEAYNLLLAEDGLDEIPEQAYPLDDIDIQKKEILAKVGHEYDPAIASVGDVISIIEAAIEQSDSCSIALHPSCVSEDLCMRIRSTVAQETTWTHYPIGSKLIELDVTEVIGYMQTQKIQFAIKENYRE